MSLVLWIFILSLVLLGIRGAVAPVLRGRAMKCVFAPGVIVAIVARSLAAFAARARLESVNFPWRHGEPVVHEPPAVRLLGPAITTLLPVAAGLGLILYLRFAIAPDFRGIEELPALPADGSVVAVFWTTAVEVLRKAAFFPEDAVGGGWRALAFLYLAAAVFFYCAPPAAEWKVVAATLALAFLAVAAADWLGLKPGFLSRGWFIRWRYRDAVFEALAVLFSMAWLVLLAAGGARFAWSFLEAVVRPADRKARKRVREKAHAR